MNEGASEVFHLNQKLHNNYIAYKAGDVNHKEWIPIQILFND